MLKHVLVAVVLFLSPVSASASTFNCFSSNAEVEYSQILTSDVIFVGELRDHELVDDLFLDQDYPHVIATFQVTETVQGKAPELAKVDVGPMYNPTGDFGVPRGSVIVFGVAYPGGASTQEAQFYLRTFFCGRRAIFVGTEQNVDAIRLWLATGEVRSHELSSDDHFGGPLTGSRPDDWLYWILMAFIALGAAIAITLTIKRLPKIV